MLGGESMACTCKIPPDFWADADWPTHIANSNPAISASAQECRFIVFLPFGAADYHFRRHAHRPLTGSVAGALGSRLARPQGAPPILGRAARNPSWSVERSGGVHCGRSSPPQQANPCGGPAAHSGADVRGSGRGLDCLDGTPTT